MYNRVFPKARGNFLYRNTRSLIFKLVYPESFLLAKDSKYYPQTRDNYTSQVNNQTGNISARQLDIDIDGNKIDAVLLGSEVEHKYNPDQQYVIFAGGNATCYEDYIDDMLDLAENKDVNVVGFNPMGVGLSEGNTSGPEDYYECISQIIQHLHQQGVPYSNIILNGESLGAAACTIVAAEYQNKFNARIKVVNCRSFAELAPTAGELVGSLASKYFPTTFLCSAVSKMVSGFVGFVLRAFNLNIQSAEAFDSINKRNYGDARCFTVEGDNIIAEKCSLSAHIKAPECNTVFSTSNSTNPHNLPKDMIYNSELATSAMGCLKDNILPEFVKSKNSDGDSPAEYEERTRKKHMFSAQSPAAEEKLVKSRKTSKVSPMKRD